MVRCHPLSYSHSFSYSLSLTLSLSHSLLHSLSLYLSLLLLPSSSLCTSLSLSHSLTLSPSPSLSLQTVRRPRKIQLPASSARPTRAVSHSNLLDSDAQTRRPRRYSDGSDKGRSRPRARSNTPDRNGHSNTLPLMSTGYKRLPNHDVAEKPIKATLLKKKLNDGTPRPANELTC